MQQNDMIPAEEFCKSYNVEFSFVHTMGETGFIKVITIEEKPFIPVEELQELEKLYRLYYDLEINLQGIEAIHHLLDQVRDLQATVISLRNKLRFYENV